MKKVYSVPQVTVTAFEMPRYLDKIISTGESSDNPDSRKRDTTITEESSGTGSYKRSLW